MKTVKILGSGCPKCKEVEAIVTKVLNENDIKAEVIKVQDIVQIMKYNVISTPVIVVDEEVKIIGKIPSPQEILEAMS